MMRGDLVPLFEALLLLLLPAGSTERTPLLEQILVFLRSDACLLAQLAQQSSTLQHVLRCAAAAATGEAKRAHAGRVVAHQLKVLLPLHPLTHPYTPLYTLTHPHIPLHTLTHPYTPLHTLTHPYMPLHPLTHPYTPLRPDTPLSRCSRRASSSSSRARRGPT